MAITRESGELLLGQLYDRELDVIVPFTEQMMPHEASDQLQGQARTEISPHDMKAAKVRVYEMPDIEQVYASFPSTININLPDVLTGVNITQNTSFSNGEDVKQVGLVLAVGSSGSFSMTPSARAQASGSVMLDAQPNIRQTWGQNIPVTTYAFFMSGNVETQQIIDRFETQIFLKSATSAVLGVVTATAHGLKANQPFAIRTLIGGSGGVAINTTYYVKTVINANSFNYSTTLGGAVAPHNFSNGTTYSPEVAEWPNFKPEAVTITLHGEQISIGQNADTTVHYTWSGEENKSVVVTPYNGSQSSGGSSDRSVSVRSVRIPPTLHEAIQLSTASPYFSQLIATIVAANTPGVAGSGGAPSFSPIINQPPTQLALIRGDVYPLTIPATTPSSIPTAGLYIADVQVRPYAYGLQRVVVTLIDFSRFA